MKVLIKYKDGHSEENVIDCTCRLPKTLKQVFLNKEVVDSVVITEL